jgi:hypothetical protein
MFKSKLFITLFILLNGFIHAQVSLAPEVGMNYRSYTLLGANSELEHKWPEPYLGISGGVDLLKWIQLQSKVSYQLRKQNVLTTDLTFNPQYIGTAYVNREISIDFHLLFKLFKGLKLGGGWGVFHKLKSRVEGRYEYTTKEEVLMKTRVPYWNAVLQYQYKRIGVHLQGFYTPTTENHDSFHLRGIQYHPYGYAIGVSYELLGRG